MKENLKEIIDWTLKKLNMESEDAADLIFKTGNAETGYRILRQMGNGPAVGFWQVEKDTIKDIWDNFVSFRKELKGKLLMLGFNEAEQEMSVLSSLALQIAMCRITYWRYPKRLPKKGDLQGQAEYWKKAYNTELGKGTVSHFIKANS